MQKYDQHPLVLQFKLGNLTFYWLQVVNKARETEQYLQ